MKSIPSILIVANCSLIVICFGRLDMLSVFIGITVVFSKFIVAPVAFCNFGKYFITFVTEYWSCRKKLELSAYCEIFNYFLKLCIFSPIIVLSLFMFFVVTSSCITYKGSESGQPRLSPRSIITDSDRNPLFAIIELMSLYFYKLYIFF